VLEAKNLKKMDVGGLSGKTIELKDKWSKYMLVQLMRQKS